MLIRLARETDLPAIVEIYNAAIPGRQATADTEPVSVASRTEWFRAQDPGSRPLWVAEAAAELCGWLSLRSFYGRPAYRATVEVGLYVAPQAQGRGIGRLLLRHAIEAAPALGIRTLLAFIFSHNQASLKLFQAQGFTSWGVLPGVAHLDEQERDLSILGRRLPL
jgi:phosphinothricin acetyltransferase